VQIGESVVGEGMEAAHGHAPFVTIIQPGIAVQPPTLFANNRAAMTEALLSRLKGAPAVDEMLAALDDPWNPFSRPR
jgi:formaldehyde-activating enzyme involved in methanogenesis